MKIEFRKVYAVVPENEVLVDHFGCEGLEVVFANVEGDAGSLVQLGAANLRYICKKEDEELTVDHFFLIN